MAVRHVILLLWAGLFVGLMSCVHSTTWKPDPLKPGARRAEAWPQ